MQSLKVNSSKIQKAVLLGMIVWALFVSCVTTSTVTTAAWEESILSFEEVHGIVIKRATIQANEKGNLIISGAIEITHQRQPGGGHIDLIVRENGVETVLSSGNHIPSRRGIISQRPKTFRLDGNPIRQSKGEFILRFHRGNPKQHSSRIGYNWTLPAQS